MCFSWYLAEIGYLGSCLFISLVSNSQAHYQVPGMWVLGFFKGSPPAWRGRLILQSLSDAGGGIVPMECLGTDWQLCVVPCPFCNVQYSTVQLGTLLSGTLGVFKMISQIFLRFFGGFFWPWANFCLSLMHKVGLKKCCFSLFPHLNISRMSSLVSLSFAEKRNPLRSLGMCFICDLKTLRARYVREGKRRSLTKASFIPHFNEALPLNSSNHTKFQPT